MKGELKDWAVSRVRADIRWVESSSGEDAGDDLVMHRFDFDEDALISARYLPGGGIPRLHPRERVHQLEENRGIGRDRRMGAT